MENVFLKNITREIYNRRIGLDKTQKVFCRYERVDGGVFAEVWFMTRGCKHDRDGGCTMCNYGKGYQVSDDEILGLIESKLAEINMPLKQLVISPSGSMFDEEEVSHYLRREIFKLASKFECEKFITETRADTINFEKLTEMKQLIPHKNIAIELGLESANPWVLKYCVNKNLNLEDFESAVRLIKQAGLQVTANVSLGAPFMSEREQIEDAVDSVKWALEMEVDTVVVFPIHVKPGTLVSYLYESGGYNCVSLWSLVQVLKEVEEKFKYRVQISWYKNYYDNPKKILLSPNTCDDCKEEVIHILDDYKNSCNTEIIDKLHHYNCHCKGDWGEKLKDSNEKHGNLIMMGYQMLGETFGIDRDMVKQAYEEALTELIK
ncbi:hypothetical protein R2R35_24140 [Anaerocolumna sp. AGMB13020]|uniref:hypothetical protein n=1 Tax=Anaerocolumna sp. AGMB13020 TaxID=3081750 RepID=UPI002955C8CF|nr:hypothetical protein [Anaerocolumna sp. AGMB13020]WOO36843.1 hypothetical protein R2R35_24140 [Anaerocolumna sp. AGMB13020]